MQKVNSQIPFDYVTVKTTRSRIDKGLLAIPVSLYDLFPKHSRNIFVVGNDNKEEQKTFTPYSSSSKECRIGRMRAFYERFKIEDGDELVIQVLDDGKFKIFPEKLFQYNVREIERNIEKAGNENEAETLFEKLSSITNRKLEDVIKSEFVRLANEEVEDRQIRTMPQFKARESAPASIRKILLSIYNGKCQITNFTFKMRNTKPYFEIHHIEPTKGNHLKNLVVVSPNVHAQFTYANLHQTFDDDGWLRKVKFNEESFSVFQIVDKLPKSFHKEIHF